MFKPDHCSPGNDNNISCIELPLLKKIAKILNQQPECSPININSKQQLYNQIKKEMNKISDCDSESCWILEDKIKNNLSKHEYEMLMDEFRPIEPLSWVKNETEWLNTNDINNVMEQYEIKYPDFKFMGANPIDFNVKLNNIKTFVIRKSNPVPYIVVNEISGLIFLTKAIKFKNPLLIDFAFKYEIFNINIKNLYFIIYLKLKFIINLIIN